MEYWATLGQQVAPPDPQAVFAALEADRLAGALASQVTTTAVRSQACAGRPGLLERLGPDGSRCIGRFRVIPIRPKSMGSPVPKALAIA